MTEDEQKEPTLLDVAKSVLWAFLGLQKSKNYECDFKYGKLSQYIIIGLIGIAIFIFILVMVVQFVLSLAGV